MWCGEEIEPETIEASTLVCEDCTEPHCVCCGDVFRDDNLLGSEWRCPVLLMTATMKLSLIVYLWRCL